MHVLSDKKYILIILNFRVVVKLEQNHLEQKSLKKNAFFMIALK